VQGCDRAFQAPGLGVTQSARGSSAVQFTQANNPHTSFSRQLALCPHRFSHPHPPQNLNVGNIVAKLWPGTPDVLRNILSAAAFKRLAVSYDTKTRGFGVDGTPDLSGAEILK
jgi:hypothetical protein